MTEYYTEAIVLKKENFNDTDGLVYFYTDELGKVVAKARGLKKILSKSNPHLEPLNFVKLRLVSGKNGYLQIIDALSFNTKITKKIKNSPEKLLKLLRLADFIKETAPEMHRDQYIWHAIKKVVANNYDEHIIYRLFLKIMGFDAEYANCIICYGKNPHYFFKEDQSFICKSCAFSAMTSALENGELIKLAKEA
ncbi:MAG: DNA repair protein RecO [Patescibacteria group bacterium]|nr:DNA repair protein RecO [Patescibacteria group bacterium]